MARPSLSQLLTRSSGLMVARIAGGVLALLVNIWIARAFGADALGIFALVMAAVSLVAIALPLGYQAVGVMFVSQYLEQDKPGLVRGFAARGYRNIAVLTGIGVAAVSLGLALAPHAAVQDHFITAAFVVAMAPALALINFNGALLNGHRRPFAALLPDLLVKPACMMLAVAMAVFLFEAASSWLLLGVICAALWASALTQMVCLRKTAGHGTVERETGRWNKAALPWILITLLSDYFIEVHLLFAGALAAPAQVAVLHICFRLRVLAAFGLRALYALILPDIFASYEREDAAEFRSNLMRANMLALVYAVSVCAVLVPLGSWVLSIFGDEFVTGRRILLIVCGAMVIRAAFGPAPAIMAMKGHHFAAIWILLAGLAVSVATGLVLFPMFGVEAIAIAYTLTYSLVAVGQWLWVKRTTGIDCSIFAGLRRPGGELAQAG